MFLRLTFITYLFFFVFCQAVHSQRDAILIDSLEGLYDTAESDLHKIDILLSVARIHMLAGVPDLGLSNAAKAHSIARSIGSLKYESIATTYKGMMYYNMSEPYRDTLTYARDLALESRDPNAIAFSSYSWVEIVLHDYDRGITILEDLIATYKDKLSQKNLGNVYKTIAWKYEQVGRVAEAEAAYRQGIDIFAGIAEMPDIDPDLGRPSLQLIDKGHGNWFQCNVYLGQLYNSIGDHENAIKQGHIAHDAALNDSDLAYSSKNLGDFYNDGGNYTKGIKYLNQSVRVHETLDEDKYFGSSLTSLGDAYLSMGDAVEAEKVYYRAYIIFKETPEEAADMLVKLAGIYDLNGQRELSIANYIKADSLYQTIDDEQSRIVCQLSISTAMADLGRYESAISNIENQIVKIEAIRNYELLYSAYNGLASIEQQRNNTDVAINHALKSSDIARNYTRKIERIRDSYGLLASLYAKREDFKPAFEYQYRYQQYNDSLQTQNAVAQLKNEQVRQNVNEYIEEKEEAEKLARVLKNQNRLYLLIGGLLLLFLGFVSYLFLQLRKTRKVLENQNTELENLNATKDRFFGIIAHDIRSPILALESVDEQMEYYSKKGKADKVISLSKMVGDTSRHLNGLLDNLLNWALSQTGMIPYHPQSLNIYEAVDDTLQLLSANAITKSVKLENEVSSELMAQVDADSLQTILRNIIGNALKFTPAGGEINISSTAIGGYVNLKIRDTGSGMSEDRVSELFSIGKKNMKGTSGEKGAGLGMVLVKELVELNKGTIEVKSKVGQGTVIELVFPMS